jgi:osmotically-inducible protein OsmY
MKSDSVLRRVLLGEAAGKSAAPPIAAAREFGASVRALAGVGSVVDRILVSSRTATTEEVRKEIRISLRRSRKKDVEGILIDAEDGKVTLRGKLRSLEERDDAGIAAWFAPGVSEVVNDLVVSVK